MIILVIYKQVLVIFNLGTFGSRIYASYYSHVTIARRRHVLFRLAIDRYRAIARDRARASYRSRRSARRATCPMIMIRMIAANVCDACGPLQAQDLFRFKDPVVLVAETDKTLLTVERFGSSCRVRGERVHPAAPAQRKRKRTV